jgi:hypothetical protein
MTSWLHRYGNRQHEWHKVAAGDRVVFERQLGLVEASFDVDGVHYGGRADLTHSFEFEIRTNLNQDQLLNRIVLAWTVLRLHHVLLLARAEDIRKEEGLQRCFVVSVPKELDAAIAEARQSVSSFLDHPSIDNHEFRHHALNIARIIQPEVVLSRLFILPPKRLSDNRYRLPFLILLAHSIADGLSLFHWMGHFVDLINQSDEELKALLTSRVREDAVKSRLPPAQEDLYPPVAGNMARQRWFWAIVRILRHVRKPLPPGFTNPLRRTDRIQLNLEPKFSDIFDYTKDKLPPLNSGSCTPTMSLSASKRLAKICREAGTSVGAGVFALVGLVMMEMYEKAELDIPLSQRRPFIASFPLNPRPFFNYTGPHDSCMLAFSNGIVIPFLPSYLPLEGSLRLLARAAHRQLKTYQKRRNPTLSSHSPIRMIASNYLTAVERAEDKLPPQYRTGVNPQGRYPANVNFQTATCGVSSVGLVKDVQPGKYDLDDMRSKDLVADFRELKGGVRARDNEFLCGNSSDAEGRLEYSVSYDASAMDEGLVEEWKRRMETILEPEAGSRL